MADKFSEKDRSFRTRLEFIRSIFADKFPPEQIMAKCIEHKLQRSLESYMIDLDKSSWILQGKDPVDVLKRIDD